ncbi:MAG: adenosine-specific kinase [Thaumarchaeota archaeon]|jgi:adenosine/AMP kinase|nr:adenosine-specific kinase [Candidatus Terraquivivens yellowstonensis]MCL7387719.1 adenosine-specific kinase [Candidatus Terraquivivens yellowstonensis]MCL7392542.1 adenosine-specific kinase [Candidatus Terraquivivens yellowstonensis]MCL7395200.1 adenosine-specific kinase [Candidatus Terraquivivens yellowstonensis]MCL7398057.1 adenosine-specific kinase [Candidatus Terraquivivens yellowstonensis]
MEIVDVKIPEGCNVIFGITHFIKSVEDIYEAIMNSVPGAKFGLAFAEASGPCLIRHEGTDEELRKLAAETLLKIGCGHTFLVFIKDMYPINVLNRLKEVPEVCTILAATANPLQIVVVESEQGRGVLGVIDGYKSKGIEGEEDIKKRKEFLRKIGYKL